MENPRPALRGGVAGRGARKRPPAFILHFFRPPGSPATFGCAEFAGWRTPGTHFGHGCACGVRWLVTFRIAEGAHSGAQAVTLSCTYPCGERVPLRLADAQPPHPSAPTAVRRTDPEPVGSDGWCTLDTYTHTTGDMQRRAADIVGGFLTAYLGEEMKPWQNAESGETAASA